MASGVNHQIEGDVCIVYLSGQLDGRLPTDFEGQLLALVTPEQHRLVFNLAEVDFLTNTGVRILINVRRAARAHGGDLRLAEVSPRVRDVLAMGYSDLVSIYGSVSGAIESYHSEAPIRLNNTGALSSGGRWSEAFLDKMRHTGDPQADAVIAEIFKAGEAEAVNHLMKVMINNDYLPSNELPPIMADFLEATTHLPPWADWSRIRRGQELFQRYGLQFVAILYCGSLPMTYAARKGVHVLWSTQRMNKEPYRRIVETGQMVLDVMTPGGLHEGGMGIRSTQKVRLMHAAVRHLLANSSRWDAENYQLPINQEDMAGTLIAFSTGITQTAPKIGLNLSSQEIEDYHHTWRVAGYLMGLLPEMLPIDATDSAYLGQRIFDRQCGGTAETNLEGRELTAVLLRMLEEMIRLPGLNDVPKMLVRYMIGDSVGDLLGVGETSVQAALKPLQWASALLKQSNDSVGVVGKVSGFVFRRIMYNLMYYKLGGQRSPFHIPTSLQQEWHITEEQA
jgi:anti-anti-sigma factor